MNPRYGPQQNISTQKNMIASEIAGTAKPQVIDIDHASGTFDSDVSFARGPTVT